MDSDVSFDRPSVANNAAGLEAKLSKEQGHEMNSTYESGSESTREGTAQTGPGVDTRPGAKAGMTITQFWIAFAGLNLGMLLTALDFNIVATAVPIISSEFNSYKDSSWLGTGFLVTFGLSLPIYAKLGDIFGRQNMFAVGTVIFLLGSGLCGGSKSMTMLIWSRVVQGFGGGGIYGLVNVIVTDLVPLRDVGKYLATTAAIWGIADIAGPLLGGAFSEYVSWRWCFWVNLIISPISLGVTLLVLRQKIPEGSTMQKIKRFDYLGLVLLCGGTTALLLGVSWGGNTFSWSSRNVIGCIVGGITMLALFGVAECFVMDPLIDPVLFKNRTVQAVCISEIFYGMNLLGMMYYIPQFFQLVFGDSATISGVGLLPMMLGLGIGNPIAGFVTSKAGVSKWNAVTGAGLVVLFSGLITRWNAGTSRAEAYVELVFLGAGQGAIMSGLLLTAQVAVPPMLIGIVTGLVIFSMIIGSMFGIAFFAAVYINELTSHLQVLSLTSQQVQDILQNVHIVRSEFDGPLSDQIIHIWANSLTNGWWLMFACAVVCLAAALGAKQHKFA